MKKITFIVFALISGSIFGQSETAEAVVNAEIVEALTITNNRALNFGRIIAGNGAEIVKIAANEAGDRTISAGANASGVTPTSAKFTITASDYTYSIVMSDTDLTATGLTPMTLTPVSNLGSSSSGDQVLYVGGELEVGASQEVGQYAGKVTVTINYN